MGFYKNAFVLVVGTVFIWELFLDPRKTTVEINVWDLNLNIRNGQVRVSSKTSEVVLNGYLASSLNFNDGAAPVPCDPDQGFVKNAQSQCVEYPGRARVTISGVRKSVGTCYQIAWESLQAFHHPQDCFSFTGGHWYGGAEVFEQHWPINSQTSKMQPYQSGDFLNKDFIHSGMGKYGPILEPYWISSRGVGIYVDASIPLHVSFNEEDSEEICLRADPLGYLHPDEHANERSILTYLICTADDVRSVHELMSSSLLHRPTEIPDQRMFKFPIWSTWARYKTNINETLILSYAQEIKDHGFSNSQLEIDDKYTTTYGDLEWDLHKFPHPKKLVSTLHQMGFRVTAWTHPFANVDSKAFQHGTQHGYWLKDLNGKAPGLIEWWQGIAGVLDTTNPEAVKWFLDTHRAFQKNYGIDSFKFDAGELNHVPPYFRSKNSIPSPNLFTNYYAHAVASIGGMVELRAAHQSQDLPVFVRMLDKLSRWDQLNGLQTVIPTALLMSTLGYHFILPDMIGGNAYSEDEFSIKTILPDRELFIRWVELSAYLPVMQFSIAPWDYDDEVVQLSLKYVRIHEDVVTPIVLKAAEEVIQEGRPIIRPLWWIDPHDANNLVIDSEFLVGDNLLVAPILEEGARSRDIYLPSGRWLDNLRGKRIEGRKWLRNYRINLHEIATFEHL